MTIRNHCGFVGHEHATEEEAQACLDEWSRSQMVKAFEGFITSTDLPQGRALTLADLEQFFHWVATRPSPPVISL